MSTNPELDAIIAKAREKIEAKIASTPAKRPPKLACPSCMSTYHYYSRKSNTFTCRRCGFRWDAETYLEAKRPPRTGRKKQKWGTRKHRNFKRCREAAEHLATLVCGIYHPGDTMALKTWPVATWAEIIAQHLRIPKPQPATPERLAEARRLARIPKKRRGRKLKPIVLPPYLQSPMDQV